MLLLFQIYRSNIITPNCYTSEAAPGSWRPPETGEMETQHRTIIGYCTGASSFYTCYLTILTCPETRKLPMQSHKGFLRWANTIVSCCMVPSAILWQAAVWGEEENDEIKSVMPHRYPSRIQCSHRHSKYPMGAAQILTTPTRFSNVIFSRYLKFFVGWAARGDVCHEIFRCARQCQCQYRTSCMSPWRRGAAVDIVWPGCTLHIFTPP